MTHTQREKMMQHSIKNNCERLKYALTMTFGKRKANFFSTDATHYIAAVEMHIPQK